LKFLGAVSSRILRMVIVVMVAVVVMDVMVGVVMVVAVVMVVIGVCDRRQGGKADNQRCGSQKAL
jgi:hypothetical protein